MQVFDHPHSKNVFLLFKFHLLYSSLCPLLSLGTPERSLASSSSSPSPIRHTYLSINPLPRAFCSQALLASPQPPDTPTLHCVLIPQQCHHSEQAQDHLTMPVPLFVTLAPCPALLHCVQHRPVQPAVPHCAPIPCGASPLPEMGFPPPPPLPSGTTWLPASTRAVTSTGSVSAGRHPVLEYKGVHMRGVRGEASPGATPCYGTYHGCKTWPLLPPPA